jgi:rSAM/selenodomain-associated transferase 2
MTTFAILTALTVAAAAGLAAAGATWLRLTLYLALAALLPLLVARVPAQWSRRRVTLLALCAGCALRAMFLPLAPASDVYRYVWEGFVQTRGLNPYLLAPADAGLAPLAAGPMAAVLPLVNHPELTAIYGPLAQLVFWLLAALRPEPFFFKCVFGAMDAITLLLLGWLLARRDLPAGRLFYYAANPLPLVFIAGEGHLDSLMTVLLLLGMALMLAARPGKAFFCIGLAAMVKYLAWFAVPFLLTGRNWRYAPLCLVPLGLFAPYADAGGGLFASLLLFGTRLHYHDGLTDLLRLLFGAAALPLAALVLLGAWLAIFLTVHEPLRAVFLAGGALLLCLPTLHPWYLLPLAPLAAALASPAWLFLQAALAAAALPAADLARQTGIFQEVRWHKLLAYLPGAGMLARAALVNGVSRGRRWPPPRGVSVVIPTLDEEARLGDCLASLAHQAGVVEIVVADGGSGDATRAVASQGGARVITGSAGRGRQIAAGIAHARGDVILVLHADCRATPGLGASILAALRGAPEALGGALAMEFARREGPGLALIAALNNLRARVTGIAFGDQGQFFRREVLPAIGGFPEQALMEDVELALRLKETGRVLFLPHRVIASGRRWRRQGMMRGAALVVWLLGSYLLERRFRRGTDWVEGLYARYYGRPPR